MFLTVIKIIDMPEMHAKEAVAATNWKVEGMEWKRIARATDL
jgi:hypothetical protein